MEGVRTNAICMILHVLARPGCAHRVSAFCLRFPLAFLAAVTQPPRNEGGRRREKRGGGRREGVANRCKLLCGGRDTKLFFLVFLGETVEYRRKEERRVVVTFRGVGLSGWKEIIGKNLPYRHVRMTNNWNGEAAPLFRLLLWKLDLTRI